MIYKIRNTAARPVSLHLNSGRTVHLSPGLELDLDEVEIINNHMLDKLRDKKLLSLVTGAKAGESPAVSVDEESPAGAGAIREGYTNAN
jgi:hypothetical protein